MKSRHVVWVRSMYSHWTPAPGKPMSLQAAIKMVQQIEAGPAPVRAIIKPVGTTPRYEE